MTDKKNGGNHTSDNQSDQTPIANTGTAANPDPVAASAPPSGKAKTNAKPAKAKLTWAARLVLLFSLLLSLAAAGVVGYLFYQQQLERNVALEERNEITRELQGRTTHLEQIQKQIDEITRQRSQERRAIRSANDNREVLEARMSTLEENITSITGTNRIDWMLREVEHFVTVAEQRLSLLGDTRGALALLTEADGIVRAMQEPTARRLREALLKDIHKLKEASASNVDVDGVFIRISSLTERVDKLGIPSYDLKQGSVQTPSEAIPDDGMALFVYRFDHFLKSLFNYQKHEKGRPAVLTADREFLVQSVILLLQQAQLALLSGDNEAYHLSLLGAKQRAQLFIHQQSGESKLFVTEVNDLLKVQLAPKVPSIESSLRAVQVFREFWSKEKLLREQQAMSLHRENDKKTKTQTKVKQPEAKQEETQ